MTGYTLNWGGTHNVTVDELVGIVNISRICSLEEQQSEKKAQKKHNNNNNNGNIKQHKNCELRCHL